MVVQFGATTCIETCAREWEKREGDSEKASAAVVARGFDEAGTSMGKRGEDEQTARRERIEKRGEEVTAVGERAQRGETITEKTTANEEVDGGCANIYAGGVNTRHKDERMRGHER